jgi:probable rRNA maturation factor
MTARRPAVRRPALEVSVVGQLPLRRTARPRVKPAGGAKSGSGLSPRRKRSIAWIGRWLATAAPRQATGSVTIAILPDARVRDLNRRFRGQDEATDVLSFPHSDKSIHGNELGEIAIASGVARRQAIAQGHVIDVELKVLALHGLLHLLGYDHDRDEGEMRRLEERLRRRAGLPAGLIARAPRAAKVPNPR